MAPITIRPLHRADVPAAQQIWKDGMLSTISGGARRAQFIRWGGCAAAALVGFIIVPASWGLVVRLLMAWCADLLVSICCPTLIAYSYVKQSLSEDMDNPVAHYCSGGHSGFWVAVEGGQQIVGTIACEPPVIRAGDRMTPWRADGREVELRRMSVARSHRRRGIAKLLVAALEEHARAQGFTRIVLGTSSWQATAAYRAYPRLGFNLVKIAVLPWAWLPVVSIHFFSKDIRPPH